MKLLVAIVQDYDASRLLRALVDAGFGATYIGSTGGFLRSGTAAVLVGVEDERAPAATAIIQRVARTRVEAPASIAVELDAEMLSDAAEPVVLGGAHVFVLRVSRFERM